MQTSPYTQSAGPMYAPLIKQLEDAAGILSLRAGNGTIVKLILAAASALEESEKEIANLQDVLGKIVAKIEQAKAG